MKKIFVIILSVFALVGCTLEEKVISSSEPSTYYQTVPQCITGLNGCYIPLRSIYSSGDYFEACEVASDLIYHTTASYYDAHCDYTQSIPRMGSSIWNNCYQGIMRCNAMFAAIERAPLYSDDADDEDKKALEDERVALFAECEILRAFYYYILTINFGNVPYYFEEVTDANNERISQLPRMDAVELRDILMTNLEYWLLGETPALPHIKTYDPSNEYRIGAMVGLVIGGKLAMWNKDWDRAVKFFQPIIDIYGCPDSEGGFTPSQALLGYSLKDVMFRVRYAEESIFELPAYAKDYGLKVTHGIASRCSPFRKSTAVEGGDITSEDDDILVDEDNTKDNSKKDDMYSGVRIPEMGREMRTTDPYKPSKYMHKTLMPYNSKDKRRAVYDPNKFSLTEINEVEGGGGWLAWCYSGWYSDENIDAVPRHMAWFDTIKDQNITHNSTRPLLGDKFWCPGMVYTQDSNNKKIFRLAHVLFDMAEAKMRLGQWDEANGYLNASRVRAGLDMIEPTTEEEFMEELQKESARELFGEFTRRHNLVRWGIFYDQIMAYSDDTKLKDNLREAPCREYYPIPDVQIVLSNYNLDNEEYTKWGL